MGLDLKLYVDIWARKPYDWGDLIGGWTILRDGFSLPRWRDLQAAIGELNQTPITGKVTRYEDDAAEDTDTDDYGDKLHTVRAGDLVAIDLDELYGKRRAPSPWLRAVWAFLRELPPDYPVLLWWH